MKRPEGRELTDLDRVALDGAQYDYAVAIAEAGRAKQLLERLVRDRIAPYRVGDVVKVAHDGGADMWTITEVYMAHFPMLRIYYRARSGDTGLVRSSVRPVELAHASAETVQ